MNTERDFNDSVEVMGEIVGQMRAAIETFNQRLGEVMAQQRLTTQDQRDEGTRALEYLKDISQQALRTQMDHQRLVKVIEQQWPKRMDEVARGAGSAQAQAFGEAIATEIQAQLIAAGEHATHAAQRVEQASHALRWKAALLFAGLAVGFSLILGVVLWGWSSSVRSNVEALETRRLELTRTLDTLKEAGGELDVAHCAPGDQRLCVHIEAERFGPRKDYAPVKYRQHP